jgi:polyribonucleotide nucleotidyltransferase
MNTKEIKIQDKTIKLETGKIAKQTAGSVMVTSGETMVLVTVCASKGKAEDRGFFPLSVDYREKFYAAGRIPGGFFKREARPSEKEILACRLTDRPLRPLFPKGFLNETIVSINVLSYDGENEPEVLGTIGASAALSISDIPWDGPVASIGIGRVEGKFIVNPSPADLETSDMSMVVSGTADSIVMVEGVSNFISEDDVLSAIEYGHGVIKDIVSAQVELAKECGLPKREVVLPEENVELHKKIDNVIKEDYISLNDPKNKADRYSEIDDYVDSIVAQFEEDHPDDLGDVKSYVNDKISDNLRERTLAGSRADGRSHKDVRNIEIETAVLPRAHGSALFTRGETQSLTVTTLGGKREEQMLDNISGLTYKAHMLHYNFPPFCVGEARPKFSLSRREVGHGNLAERAIVNVLPDFEDFPYTIRIVSEILESNGSSSMATVCAGVLSLMDAGVPIKEPVAGIAMGLIMENEKKYCILTDILGTEDHLGDMDFKIAGSKEGITAIQMDLKIDGLPMDIMREALQQAKEGRSHILDEMNKVMSEPNKLLSQYAPKIQKANIPPDKIGEFIGPGGKNIKAIQEEYEVDISIEDSGLALILGTDHEKLEQVLEIMKGYSMVPEVGKAYEAEVVSIQNYGAFVKIAPGKEGLLHISQIRAERVEKVEDVLKVGQKITVKLLKIDDNNRLDFSIKALEKKQHS